MGWWLSRGQSSWLGGGQLRSGPRKTDGPSPAYLSITYVGSDQTVATEDVKKIHAEVLQIVNQRFLLTTSAVVFFATVAGWVTGAVMKDGTPPEVGENIMYLPLIAATLVVGVLYALFSYQASLMSTLRWLTTYLMVRGSEWERDWCEFRRTVLDEDARDDLLKQVRATTGTDFGAEVPFRAYLANPSVFRLLARVSFVYFSVLHFLLWKNEIATMTITGGTVTLGPLVPIALWAFASGALLLVTHRMHILMCRSDSLDERGMHEVWVRIRAAVRNSSVTGPRSTAAHNGTSVVVIPAANVGYVRPLDPEPAADK